MNVLTQTHQYMPSKLGGGPLAGPLLRGLCGSPDPRKLSLVASQSTGKPGFPLRSFCGPSGLLAGLGRGTFSLLGTSLFGAGWRARKLGNPGLRQRAHNTLLYCTLRVTWVWGDPELV